MGKIELRFRQKILQPIKFTYTANVSEGQLLPVPEVIKFKPEKAATAQSMKIEMFSSLDFAVQILDVTAEDSRFSIKKLQNQIKGDNGFSSEVL